MSMPTLPVVDLDIFLSGSVQSEHVFQECKKVCSQISFKSHWTEGTYEINVQAADALVTYGALLVHDSRVSEDDNSTFLDLLEDYFAQPIAALKMDERPEVGYQVGVTLENTEKPKCAVDEPCLNVIARLDPAERPLDISAHSPDPKCRFFWKMSEKPPYETRYPTLNAPNVVPEAADIRERWTPVMEKWGRSMKNASHLLAPTASDLVKYGQKDTILAGFHTDLNFLTIHGRSRYPGLNIWARNTGKRLAVRFPPTGRYLLVQAGKQLEHLSVAIEQRKAQFPDRPLIRISSTFFWHLSSDYDLAPISSLQTRADALRTVNSNKVDVEEETTYEPMKVGTTGTEVSISFCITASILISCLSELRHIALMAS
ncbi:hypothetical protein A0H81_00804 [Grifola frondosa]|uniref:Clavaminate synthase-like protein n=1 Tax=Grifola frondosa TaxID=5627 RepID=A0A1C7MRK2_GRIFR|nr:hypothetical protein A0H81_00804 [Grifola frondosa]